jgi:enediyne polyketide synthase
VLACHNGERDHILAGRPVAIAVAEAAAKAAGFEAATLRVSHAFHSPDMVSAAAPFRQALADVAFAAPQRWTISTVSGAPVTDAAAVPDLLAAQLTEPVRFAEALASAGADLFVEVGPGAGLTRLAAAAGRAAVAVDAHGPSLAGLLAVLAEVFVRGAAVDAAGLCRDRPFPAAKPWRRPVFVASPCGEDGNSAPAVLEAGDAEEPPQAASNSSAPAESGAAASILERVQAVIAAETGLPAEAIAAEARLLDALHLNSLAVGRIVGRLAQIFGLPAFSAPTEHANASVAQLTNHLEELAAAGVTAAAVDRFDGVAAWVAPYAMRWRAADLPRIGRHIDWQTDGSLLRVEPGLALDTRSLAGLWHQLRAAVASGRRHLAILHDGAPVFALAGSLFVERLFDTLLLVDGGDAARQQALLKRPPRGFSAWRLPPEGGYEQPVFTRLDPEIPVEATAPGPADLFLVTGGGRGIGAECAIALAQATGVALLLVGRSPETHPEVAATLARCAALRLRARYRQADGTDAAALALACRSAADWGPVTGLIHAAGHNRPARFADIDDALLAETLRPKLEGLSAAVSAAGAENLRWAVTFGSIIGRLGLAGEAHYALANAAQSDLLERLVLPHARAHALEWSVWAGAGMGERLGTLEHLAAKGVLALTLDDALAAFVEVLTAPQIPAGAVVLTGRFGPPPGIDLGGDLPDSRFLERVRVYFPGQEIVADSVLRPATDPYLLDHVLGGTLVMPGAMLLEAMTQAAAALRPEAPPRRLTNLRFEAAVTVAAQAPLTLRVAALRGDGGRNGGRVDAAVLADDDGFTRQRARVSFHWDDAPSTESEAPTLAAPQPAPAAPVYASLLFQSGRFQRLAGYDHLAARHLRAALAPADGAAWVGGFLGNTLLLGDPGARDAGLHALQASVPHRRVLPVACAGIDLRDLAAPRASLEAWERRSDGRTYVFDIVWRDAAGQVVEVWHEAAFRAVGPLSVADLTPALIAPYIERTVVDALRLDSFAVAFGEGRTAKAAILAQLNRLGRHLRRSDGKPVALGIDSDGLSLADSEAAALAVSGHGRLACDLEPTSARPWPPDGVNGDARLIVETAAAWHDTPAAAALRVWCARECLRKAGYPPHQPLTITHGADGSPVFAAAGSRIVTLPLPGHIAAVLAETAK